MLELSGLSAGYGGFQALFGVSLQVEAGEAVAVIGANGAGKTTLLRVISGLLDRTAGTMTMEGRDSHTPARTRGDRPASRMCRKDGGCSRGCRSRTTCGWAPSPPAPVHAIAERLEYVYSLFPRLKERRVAARRHACPAASSRCARSAAR